MKGRCFHLSLIPALGLLFTFASIARAGEIKNPYHKTTKWKLWSGSGDSANVKAGKKVIVPPSVNKRLYPDDSDTTKSPGQFLVYRNKDWPGRKYAGMWDDVYVSQDRKHSYIRREWCGKDGNSVKIRDCIIHMVMNKPVYLHRVGANFTSQSTTGMGHDITNNAGRMLMLEKMFYFANVLRAGPTHTSFRDITAKSSVDLYEALVPTFYNSVGSSSSETWALTKMVVAGGYLPKNIKSMLKTHGLYPSACLYIWKASLPYNVPYDNELRHRVAYNSKGDHSDYRGSNQTKVNHFYHNYDDTAHMKNMVELAKSMSIAPPTTIFKTIRITGGRTIYAHKTALLVHQGKGETIKLRISTDDCYDLQNLPLTFRWKILYGNKNTTIVKDSDSSTYTITVPYDARLPRGRTSILLIANNGMFDSNPAIVNIYRTEKKPDKNNKMVETMKQNLRPTLAGLEDRTILPGEKVKFEITSIDPEGFPVTLYRWTDEVGSLDGKIFRWDCPGNQAEGDYPITIVGSDGTSGNSYVSRQVNIRVRSTIAAISADRLRGQAPLKVKFSSEGSRDKKKGVLKYVWDFGDGETSTQKNPTHTFTKQGFYEVALTVKAPSGVHTTKTIIHAEHNWPLVLNNGWGTEFVKEPGEKLGKWIGKIDEIVWQKVPDGNQVEITRSMLRIYQKKKKDEPFQLTSVKDFSPPFYLEAVYHRLREGSKHKKGAGFQLLGTKFGYPVTGSDNVIEPKLRFPWYQIRLRLFADKDTNGKLQFNGCFETTRERRFFKVDNLNALDNKVIIFSGNLQCRFDIQRFRVWAPGRKDKGSKITVQGDGI